MYCYYLNNRISNSLFGLWTFNLILITTSTKLQNKFYFLFLSKFNSEANPLVHFNVNITNKKHVSNKSRCVAALSFRMFINCGPTTSLGEISVLAAFFSKSRTTIQNVRIAFSYQKFVRCIITLTVAIACSTFEVWRQTSSARTAAIGHGHVILYRLVCTLRDSCAFSRQNVRKN